MITTIDPRLTALGLPQYPPLPANMDPTKIEEIRRTVYVGNLDSTVVIIMIETSGKLFLSKLVVSRTITDVFQPNR